MQEYLDGLKKGLAIALGYFPVSFSFGVLVASSKMPLGLATFISITNLTSSGQFAGVSLMLTNASYFEIAATLLMINARYFLMSLSLSQKIDQKMSTLQRLIVSYGVTDETFAVASIQNKTLTFSFLLGLITLPTIGWTSGSFLGETITTLLPQNVQNVMGIALYGMFLAIIVPSAKKCKPILEVVLIAIIISCILFYIPLFTHISSGFKLILTTMLASLYGAYFHPIKEENL